jgi:chromosomal replication initiation ATPase DnaA
MNYKINDAIRNMHPDMYCTPCDHHNFKVQTRRLSTFEVIDISCQYLHIDKQDLISKKRHLRLVDARNMISDMLYHDSFLNLTLQDVGIILGGRDHTTIIHGLRTIDNMIFTEPEYKEKLRQLHLHVYHTLSYFKH